MEKGIRDALNGIAYLDDSQIKEVHKFVEVDKDNPRAEVCIHGLDDYPD